MHKNNFWEKTACINSYRLGFLPFKCLLQWWTPKTSTSGRWVLMALIFYLCLRVLLLFKWLESTRYVQEITKCQMESCIPTITIALLSLELISWERMWNSSKPNFMWKWEKRAQSTLYCLNKYEYTGILTYLGNIIHLSTYSMLHFSKYNLFGLT